MHVLLKGQVFRGGEGHTGGGDTLDGGVVGQVGEQHGTVDGAGALKLADEELRLLKGDADGGKDHGEVGLASSTLAWRAIWAARAAWGRPEPEKMGSF